MSLNELDCGSRYIPERPHLRWQHLFVNPGQFLQSLIGTFITFNIRVLYSLNIIISIYYFPNKLGQCKHKF